MRWRLKRYRPIDQRTLPVAALRQNFSILSCRIKNW
jgi:hypothetical protein